MMAAPTAKSAVSDYEHLNFRYGDENQIQLSDSEDDDFLPLKSKIKQLEDELYRPEAPRPKAYNEYLSNNIESIAKVPLQSAWSPGMVVRPNPSLLISPEKDNVISAERDNILEPRDLNTVPTPVVWDPYPSLKPTVFVTPEKPTNFSMIKDLQTQKSSFLKDTTKSKERQSVRFELPSSVSGDDVTDCSVNSNSLSPITVKGKEIRNQIEEGFKNLSHSSKAYNPLIYSDDSFRNENYEEKDERGGTCSISTATNLVEKLNQLLQSSEKLEDHEDLTLTSHPASANTEFYVNKVSKSLVTQNVSEQFSDINTKSINLNTAEKKTNNHPSGNKGVKKIHSHSRNNRPGPHHLSASLSPYYPPTSGACIIREAKHPMVSTEYSYPFQSSQGNEEYEHIFSRPEFNSTLKVRSELDDLCEQEVDVQKAAEMKLSKCSSRKVEIQEKAAVYTNHTSDQFGNLVDVEPSIDRLCDRVVRMRTGGKVSNYKKGTKSRKETPIETAPDLMEFYSGDLQKEAPDLSLPGVVPSIPDLSSAPHDLAFDCYRHHRVWNGLQDF